ncbi:PaaI family thioesterase [Mycobacterium sp. shizuoka-1]|uniref:PaaI family thioesterase n=1 Tax=Mycobacteriaceae TaxID=1762 RepID=UPI000C05E7B5|nr:PaaI family thioesterase [Mycobacterium sp. shizuoka-1]GAY13867.1 hypothetical protein MSZK_05930 [Mycobacterium sp. shizuoka-1]
MSHESPSFIEIINSAMEYTIPIAHTMGVRAVEVRRGYAALSVPIEGNGNHFGVMYAGVLFTVAEMLGGVLALPVFDNARFYPLVKDVQISFLKPARTDVVSEASLSDEEIARVATEVDANGKSAYIVEAAVKNDEGTVVATTTALCQLRAHGK